MKLKIRRQARVKGGRNALPACVLPTIWKAVDIEARRHQVSRSWVIATVLAGQFKVPEQIAYTEPKKSRSS